ncbi:glycosyltransferase [Pseudomonas nitroreducens]|uniref:Glycosyltransferase n=1 Tax=Pseudomonas nitroreducens TaxID=46680 RepID=A0A246F621_PSENT|nr:glycosyltransferase [Pseudomonas nitroreducens]OWP48629.1 glycosyltransferase [Pseudomonas nitroreducens]
MKILVYSATNAATIRTSLGAPEYSYYFVLKEFLPALQALGEVVVIEDPANQVDAIYHDCRQRGEACVFLSFSPPHKTLATLECPTLPVFAWEFDTVPDEIWLNDAAQDWSFMLRQFGQAITHSRSTIDAVRKVVPSAYPLLSVPSPVWDAFDTLRQSRLSAGRHRINGKGVVFDTSALDLQQFLHAVPEVWHLMFRGEAVPGVVGEPEPEPELASASEQEPPAAPVHPAPEHFADYLRITRRYLGAWYQMVLADLLPESFRGRLRRLRRSAPVPGDPMPEVSVTPGEAPIPEDPFPQRALFTPAEFSVDLEGVVFATVFNPYDGRKNWPDLISAFCSTFSDQPDAVLVFKLTHREYCSAITEMLRFMARLPAFRCRVLLMHGYLEDEDYQALMQATAYVVNASYGEGQCLPLMEFLSCGKPAIAPSHSGMSDYIDEQVAFVVESCPEAASWPHDPRNAFRTCRQQIDWESLRLAYLQAWSLYRDHPEAYRDMGERAIERMRGYCSRQAVIEQLDPFLRMVLGRASVPQMERSGA